jgi:hypothetical protein
MELSEFVKRRKMKINDFEFKIKDGTMLTEYSMIREIKR